MLDLVPVTPEFTYYKVRMVTYNGSRDLHGNYNSFRVGDAWLEVLRLDYERPKERIDEIISTEVVIRMSTDPKKLHEELEAKLRAKNARLKGGTELEVGSYSYYFNTWYTESIMEALGMKRLDEYIRPNYVPEPKPENGKIDSPQEFRSHSGSAQERIDFLQGTLNKVIN